MKRTDNQWPDGQLIIGSEPSRTDGPDGPSQLTRQMTNRRTDQTDNGGRGQTDDPVLSQRRRQWQPDGQTKTDPAANDQLIEDPMTDGCIEPRQAGQWRQWRTDRPMTDEPRRTRQTLSQLIIDQTDDDSPDQTDSEDDWPSGQADPMTQLKLIGPDDPLTQPSQTAQAPVGRAIGQKLTHYWPNPDSIDQLWLVFSGPMTQPS